MNALYVILGVGLLVAVYAVAIFNSLQTLKTQIQASIQEIGNQLKRQASLIPNLEAAVKGYMKHEKSVFAMLTDARKKVEAAEKSGKVADIDKAIESIQAAVPQISVAVESNPEMKADTTVTRFMNELTDTADKLMYARRSVIDLTQVYNAKLVTFPSNIIAGFFKFQPEKGLETPTSGAHLTTSAEEMRDIKIDL